MKMNQTQLDAILKRDGYRVRGESVPTKALPPAPAAPAADPHTALLLRAANGEIEAMFCVQLLDARKRNELPREPHFQYKPLERRKFRLDVAFPSLGDAWTQHPYAFEVQGMVHRIRHQFKRDVLRHNLLTYLGWRMYYVTGDMVRDGRALRLVKEVVG